MGRLELSDKALRKEFSTLSRTLLLLLLGFSVLRIAKTGLFAVKEESTLIALLLLPVVIYVILSGRIQELKAPGGLEAKFSTVAHQSISAASETVKPETDELQAVLKESPLALEQKVQDLDDSKPILMVMRLGANSYNAEATRKYIEVLSQFRNFKFVVFVDHRKRFAGHMSAWSARSLLQKTALGDEFIDAVNQGLAAQLMRYPGFETNTMLS
jgi:hypothetical protein